MKEKKRDRVQHKERKKEQKRTIGLMVNRKKWTLKRPVKSTFCVDNYCTFSEEKNVLISIVKANAFI